MKTFTMDFETIDSGAILQAAAAMLVRTNSRPTIEEAVEDIGGNVDNALRLLMDTAIGEADVGELIEIQNTSCSDD